jgi:hypothetical protein
MVDQIGKEFFVLLYPYGSQWGRRSVGDISRRLMHRFF